MTEQTELETAVSIIEERIEEQAVVVVEETTAVENEPDPSAGEVVDLIDLDHDPQPAVIPDELQPEPIPDSETLKAVQSVTRLVVGGAIEGTTELVRRIKAVETAVYAEQDEDDDANTVESELVVDETTAQVIRYAFIGFIFESQQAIYRRLPRWKRMAKLGINLTRLALDPFMNNRVGNSVQSQVDNWATRGESLVSRWTSRGRQEENVSRLIARYITEDTIDDFISQLAENPEVTELVTQQSVGLASEVIDEVREQTVTADTLVERMVRSVLRRPVRQEDPIVIDAQNNVVITESAMEKSTNG